MIETVKLKNVIGANNRLSRHALQTDVGQFVAAAQNVDLDDTGRALRRSGFSEVAPLTTGRSLFSANGFTLLADGTSLKSVVSFAPYSAVTVDTVAANNISYAAINNDIYYSDGVKLGRLDQYGAAHNVAIPVPVSLSGTAIAGALDAGRYQATITYFYDQVEGGAIASIVVDLAATGGIRLTLPASPAGVTGIGVYLSSANGDKPYLHSTVAPSAGTVDLTSKATGRHCRTELKGPMPAGNIVRHYLTLLLVASGKTLYYSDSYNFGLTTPGKNYITFAEDISIVRPCIKGVYVVAGNKTYWLNSLGVNEQDMVPVLPYGAVAGSDGEMPNAEKVFWLSAKGLVVADQTGQVANLNEPNLLLDLTGSGASLFIEGNNRIVATNG